MVCLSDLGVEARLYFSAGACDYLPNAILFGTITIGLVRLLPSATKEPYGQHVLWERRRRRMRRDGNLDGSNEYACDNCDHM